MTKLCNPKVCIKYGLDISLFLCVSFGIIWIYQQSRDECVNGLYQDSPGKEVDVQTKIIREQNVITHEQIKIKNEKHNGKIHDDTFCNVSGKVQVPSCPPGYKRRFTDVLFIMDKQTGLESVKFLLQFHTQLSMGYEIRQEHLSREVSSRTKVKNDPELYCDCMPCVRSDSSIQIVELAVSYLRSKEAAIYASVIRPDMKVIVVVRDPVERLLIHLSHQLYDVRRSKLPRNNKPEIPAADWESLHSFVFATPEVLPETLINNIYVNSSIYHKDLVNWLKYYPLNDKLLVVNFNDIQRKPFKELQRIESFLGVDHEITPDAVSHRHDDCFCHISPFRSHIGDCMSKDCKDLVVDIPDDVRTLLKNHYRESNKKLYAITGKDYGWNV